MFTRKEVSELCQIKTDRLSYLDETNVVIPYKNGKVLYSYRQLLEIKLIESVRRFIPLRKLKVALEAIKLRRDSPDYTMDSQIVIIEGGCAEIQAVNLHTEELYKALKVYDDYCESTGEIIKIKLITLPSFNAVRQQILERIESSKYLKLKDFEERLKP